MINICKQITHFLAQGNEFATDYYFPPEAKQTTFFLGVLATHYQYAKADAEKQQTRFHQAIFAYEQALALVNSFIEQEDQLNKHTSDYGRYLKVSPLQGMIKLIDKAIRKGHLKTDLGLQHIYAEKALVLLATMEAIVTALYIKYQDHEKKVCSAELAKLLNAIQGNTADIKNTVKGYLMTVKYLDAQSLDQELKSRKQKMIEYVDVMSNPLSQEFDNTLATKLFTLPTALFDPPTTETHSAITNMYPTA